MGTSDAPSVGPSVGLYPAPPTLPAPVDAYPYAPAPSAVGDASVPAATMGEWSTGLCECCCTSKTSWKDCGICCLGLFCPCVLFARNVSRLNPVEHPRGCCAGWSFFGLMLLDAALAKSKINLNAPAFYSWRYRTFARNTFGIKGYGKCCTDWASWALCVTPTAEPASEDCERVCDFCIHYHCLPCALCQEAREAHRRMAGAPPAAPAPMAAPPQQQPLLRG